MAGSATREQAAAALFTLVTGAVTFKRAERHFRLPEDVSPAQTPALFQAQEEEPYERQQGILGINPKRTMSLLLMVYVTDAANTVAGVTTVGATQLNTIIQAIETAMLPAANTPFQTLGGLVQSARIEGVIRYYESKSIDGLSAATIPVRILFP